MLQTYKVERTKSLSEPDICILHLKPRIYLLTAMFSNQVTLRLCLILAVLFLVTQQHQVCATPSPILQQLSDPDDFIYPPGAKLRKVLAPKVYSETSQKCAEEFCYQVNNQKCVHMAGRPLQPAWFTCCVSGKFADFNGNCCSLPKGKVLDADNKFCP